MPELSAPPFADRLDRLRRTAPALSAAVADARATFKAVEDALREMRIGVKAAVEVPGTTLCYLSYRRCNGQFRLAWSPDSVYAPMNWTPWGELSDSDTLHAVAAIPSLLDAIGVNAEALAKRAEGAREVAAALRDQGFAAPPAGAP